MFEKLKLALDIVKYNSLDKKVENLKSKKDAIKNSILEDLNISLNLDLTKVDDKWIKDKYEETSGMFDLLKDENGFDTAEFFNKEFDLVKKLEEEINNRKLDIKLGLAEKFKNEIFK